MLSIFALLTMISVASAWPTTSAVSKEEAPILGLVCTTEKIDLTPTSEADYLDIGLKCTAENKSTVPVIFLQSTPEALSAEITNPGRRVRTAARGYFMSSSFGLDEDKWNTIVRELDQASPPTGRTFSLAPGANMSFRQTVRLTIESINGAVIYDGRKEGRNLAVWKDVTPLQLEVSFETWSILPLMINNKYAGSRQKDFGRKLRRQWAKDGYLWLDAIQAEPIPIDLTAVVNK